MATSQQSLAKTSPEVAYFAILAHLNIEQLTQALDEIAEGQRHLLLSIGYGDNERFGPRGVGVALLTVFADVARVRYLIREGGYDRSGEYSLPTEDAAEVIRVHIGTRAALNFLRLGCSADFFETPCSSRCRDGVE